MRRHPWKVKREIQETLECMSSHCRISAKAKSCAFSGMYTKWIEQEKVAEVNVSRAGCRGPAKMYPRTYVSALSFLFPLQREQGVLPGLTNQDNFSGS